MRGSKGWLLGLSGVALIGVAVTLGSPGLIDLGGAASREQAPNPGAEKIVASALAQLGTKYQPGYFAIDYPNGDIPIGQGVCTDVVIRSLRGARRDIQQLMHEDMKKRFGEYPTRYGLTRPDRNIDHRRVPNQIVFMEKFAKKLSTNTSDGRDWLPGDIVYWKMSPAMDHCGVVSNRRNSRGLPYVIHNGGSCVEEDALDRWPIVGHYRILFE
ncbi:MAG: DUF1287 domain-containing protein [Armatimonadota bacterium]|nr:DUF1287 domain-containing protein [Armatimonadota bacterium]